MGDSQDFQPPYWCLVCMHLAGPLIDSVRMKSVNTTQCEKGQIQDFCL